MKNVIRALSAVLLLLCVLAQAAPAQADPPPGCDMPAACVWSDGAIGTGD